MVIPIQSFDLPELAPYRTMKRSVEQREQGIFVAEGEKVVRRLLESKLEVLSVVLPPKWVDEYAILLQGRAIPIYVAEKPILEQLTGFSMYQGVMAVAKVPPSPTLEALVDAARKPNLFVAVDGLTSAENLGAVVRNAVAFGAHGLLVGETSSSPYLRRAVRSSMGTIFKLPVVELMSLAEALRWLRGRGIRCVAAHPHADRRTLASANFTGDCCIIFGSEGYGITSEVLSQCDEAVVIPMHSGVDSLNVGSAAAAFLYEANRQRGLG